MKKILTNKNISNKVNLFFINELRVFICTFLVSAIQKWRIPQTINQTIHIHGNNKKRENSTCYYAQDCIESYEVSTRQKQASSKRIYIMSRYQAPRYPSQHKSFEKRHYVY